MSFLNALRSRSERFKQVIAWILTIGVGIAVFAVWFSLVGNNVVDEVNLSDSPNLDEALPKRGKPPSVFDALKGDLNSLLRDGARDQSAPRLPVE